MGLFQKTLNINTCCPDKNYYHFVNQDYTNGLLVGSRNTINLPKNEFVKIGQRKRNDFIIFYHF